MSNSYRIGVEYVRGTIIGPYTQAYEFWTIDQEHDQNCIAKNHFKNDDQAIAWFKERYPEWFARGVEMRVYE